MKTTIQYIKDRKLIFSFALFYAILVTIFTILFRYLPVGVNLENMLFDKIQKDITIDSKGDLFYKLNKKKIDQLLFIDLDTSFIDHETDRIEPNKLIALFEKIKVGADATQCIFIDYYFSNYYEKNHQITQQLDALNDKLILPYNLNVKDKLSFKGNESKLLESDIELIQYPFFKDCELGYVRTFTDPVNFSHRYFKYQSDDGKHSSVPSLIYKKSNSFDANYWESFDNSMHELKFILRNKELEGKEQAVLTYTGQSVINNIPNGELKKMMQDKIVIIGLFNDYKTKYGLDIDKFNTPVDANLNGALILVNAYLNLVIQKSISPNLWFITFLVNFMVGIFVGFYYNKKIESRYAPIISIAFGILTSIIFFHLISVLFYVFLYIKLSLGISLLVYQKKYPIYAWFKGFFNTQNKNTIIEEWEPIEIKL